MYSTRSKPIVIKTWHLCVIRRARAQGALFENMKTKTKTTHRDAIAIVMAVAMHGARDDDEDADDIDVDSLPMDDVPVRII